MWSNRLSGPGEPLRRELQSGIVYTRHVLKQPRICVIHEAAIYLAEHEVRFVVSPPADSGPLPMRAMTVGRFLRRHDVDLAINAQFFYPCRASVVWDYEPRPGKPCQVVGPARSAGIDYGVGWEQDATVGFADPPATRVVFAPSPRERASLPHLITARNWLVRSGRIQSVFDVKVRAYPRSVLASPGPTQLSFIVVDGIQPGYSEGLTLTELADRLAQQGMINAVELDGGGSAALVHRSGRLNRPIHTHWPGRARPVANHLGVRVIGVQPETSAEPGRAQK